MATHAGKLKARYEKLKVMYRISDFLNRQPAFLAVKAEDRLHLVHKRFILRVVPQSA